MPTEDSAGVSAYIYALVDSSAPNTFLKTRVFALFQMNIHIYPGNFSVLDFYYFPLIENQPFLVRLLWRFPYSG